MTSVLGFLVIRGVIYLIEGPLGDTIVSEYAGHLLAVLLSLAVFPAVALFVERRNIARVLSISGRASGPNEAPPQAFVTENLEQMVEQLNAMEGEGAILPRFEVARWVKWCFETSTSKRYVGTDSHVPSQYRNIYSEFLTAHERFIARVPASESTRVLITYAEKLRADRADNPKDNGVFLEWHQTDHRESEDRKGTKQTVALHQLDPHTNTELLNAHSELKELSETDIAFWENDFVLLFNPIKDSIDPADGAPTEVRVRLRRKGTDLYKECAEYVALLQDRTQPLDRELPIYSNKLSENWKRFAAPDLRIQQTVPLIKSVVARFPEGKDRVRIFDAAAGVGFEAVTLLGEDYWIQLNEIEQSLRQAAHEYAKEKGVRIPEGQFSRTNWLELDRQFQSGKFDVVLVLGNSLCHLEGPPQLKSAISQFYSLLRPDGVLICDERNFDSIMEHLREIEPDPINNFAFNHRPERVIYPGTDVLGAPFDYDGTRLVFEYWNVEAHDGQFRKLGDGPLGSLSMYPFKRGIMRETLQTAGFSAIEVLCDLQDSENNVLEEDCDFYTYIATK